MRSFLLIGVLTVLGCLCAGQSAGTRSEVSDHAATQATPSEKPFPSDLEWKDGSGKVVRLAEFSGKPLILNFWATWCPPCKHELPWLVAIQNKYGSQGLKVVGVSLDEADDPAVTKVIASAGINYTILYGSLDSLSSLGADGLPLTFYIGKDGKVRRRVLGIASYDELEKNVQELLASEK
jgi:thiol-disulfide isomerase/thioredoxin